MRVVVDDFVVDEFSDESEETPAQKQKDDEDSDFVAEEDDSGSDWAADQKGSQKAAVSTPTVWHKCKILMHTEVLLTETFAHYIYIHFQENDNYSNGAEGTDNEFVYPEKNITSSFH